MNRDYKFELTADHIKLLRNAWVEWDDQAYQGAPAIGLKRPYGNSDVLNDVAEIVADWPEPKRSDYDQYMRFNRDGDITAVTTSDGRILTIEDLLRLHRETETALQIVLRTLDVEPGSFVQGWPRSSNWRRADTSPTGD